MCKDDAIWRDIFPSDSYNPPSRFCFVGWVKSERFAAHKNVIVENTGKCSAIFTRSTIWGRGYYIVDRPAFQPGRQKSETVPGSLKSFGGQQEDVRYGFATGFDKAEISEILWKDVGLHVFADSYLWTDCFCCVTYLRKCYERDGFAISYSYLWENPFRNLMHTYIYDK